jgi:hypothetical protein
MEGHWKKKKISICCHMFYSGAMNVLMAETTHLVFLKTAKRWCYWLFTSGKSTKMAVSLKTLADVEVKGKAIP